MVCVSTKSGSAPQVGHVLMGSAFSPTVLVPILHFQLSPPLGLFLIASELYIYRTILGCVHRSLAHYSVAILGRYLYTYLGLPPLKKP